MSKEPLINFDDLLASVEALNAQIKDVEKSQDSTMALINTHRDAIDSGYLLMDVLESKRRSLQDSIAAISMAMATEIHNNKKKYVTAYQAIQELG